MTKLLKPFKATHYNLKLIKNLTDVISPPYDVISASQRKTLEGRSPYNFCHILLTKNDDYKALGDTYRKWVAEQILVDDDTDSLYFLEHAFTHDGKKYTRLGVLALLKMDEKGGIKAHEFTLAKPKADRTRIINEVQANLSPIFGLAAKPVPELQRLHTQCKKTKPFLAFKDLDGNANRLWKISDSKLISGTFNALNRHALVIADGHHRFEVAHEYFKANPGRFKDLNYILAYVTYAQKGLLVLPTHRVVELAEKHEQILEKLRPVFHIKELSQSALTKSLTRKGIFSFGLYAHKRWYLCTLRSKDILNKKFKKSIYKEVDTYLLHELVFPLLTIKGPIEYTHNIQEAKKMAGAIKSAFLLKAIPVETIARVAHAGFRLPQKSTYFYPKVPSGALMRRFKV